MRAPTGVRATPSEPGDAVPEYRDLATATGQRFAPQLAVFWLHETKDDRSLQAAFAGAGNSPYAAPGRPVDANAIQASVGVDCRLGKHAVFNASLAGLWGSHARVTSDISAAFRWEF